MIKFDPSLVTFDIVELKSVSTALGGSITYVEDGDNKRIAVPFAVARMFSQRYKVTKYLKPVLTCVAKYDGRVVSLERHPLSQLGKLVEDGVFGQVEWTPDTVNRFDQIKQHVADGRQWYFDGRYAYKLSNDDQAQSIRDGSKMCESGQYVKLTASTVDMYMMSTATTLFDNRACMAFVATNGKFAISPPIWKDLSTADGEATGVAYDDEVVDTVDAADNAPAKTDFNTIDDHYCVNLNFALKAAKEVGALCGYEAIEPLHLSRLMVELCTVNLPNVPTQVKATYDIGMAPSHAVAWILGISRTVNTLDSLMTVRSLLKYVMGKGMFKRDALTAQSILYDGKTIDDVPLLSIDEIKLTDSATAII